MIRVVLDTNVVVSSLLSAGSPKAVFGLALKPAFVWYVSEPIMAEYEKVLAYPRLQIDPHDARRVMTAYPQKRAAGQTKDCSARG
jgi:putative PIN family toxin of toxin-antitoxin system